MDNIQFEDWGRIDYSEALARQRQLFEEMLVCKRNNRPVTNRWVICEHNPVITLGKSGHPENLLLGKETLEKRGIVFFNTDRGGDITFHGPGQIVGYPILDLEQIGIGLRRYIWMLEELVIRTMDTYGIRCDRLEGASGVWLDAQGESPRKICAIGVKSSRFVTMHGFALNINTDLSYFNCINPCGFTNKGVTSLARELGVPQNVAEVKRRLRLAASDLLATIS